MKRMNSPLVLVVGGAAAAVAALAPRPSDAPAKPNLAPTPSRPLAFERNVGQVPGDARYVARTGAGAVLLAPDAAVFAPKAGAAVAMRFEGAVPDARIVEGRELPERRHFLRGSDPAKWRTGVPTFERVEYVGLWPGVDLVCRGDERRLEYDFVVAPGADASRIELSFDGAKSVRVDDGGDVVLATASGEMRHGKPFVYQDTDVGRVAVDGRFALRDGGRVGFEIGAHDRSRPVVVDPTVTFSTLLGGADSDYARTATIGPDGSVYLVGDTRSTDFPITVGAFQDTHTPGFFSDVFVTRLTPDGTGVVWSTFLGGAQGEIAEAVTVAPDGSVFIAGHTGSTDFPTTPGAFQTVFGGESDCFVTKLAADGGSLGFSTFLGGTGWDAAAPKFVVFARMDAHFRDGAVTVTGTTQSSDFPTTAGAQQRVFGGSADAFVTRFNTDGTLTFSTFLGGPGEDMGRGLFVDPEGRSYVVGSTAGSGFPTQSPFQPFAGGGTDAFVTKLDGSGDILWSSRLGGPGYDEGQDIVVNGDGAVFVCGGTEPNFPTTAGAFQRTTLSSGPGFVVRIAASGSAIAWSSLLSGSNYESANAIVLDPAGRPVIVGSTSSSDFPTLNAPQSLFGGTEDAFVTKFQADGSGLVWSTFLGGPAYDFGFAVATHGNTIGVGGYAYTPASGPGFPTTPGAFQTAHSGSTDAFFALFSADDGGGGGGGGGGTFTAGKGTLKDSTTPGGDKASVTGTIPKQDKTWDPRSTAGEVSLGDDENPFVVQIAPNATGWKGKKGKWTFKSPKKTTPSYVLKLDGIKGKFAVTLKKFDFPAALGTDLHLKVSAGGVSGEVDLTAREGKPGSFRFP
jgi:hypothetical protein